MRWYNLLYGVLIVLMLPLPVSSEEGTGVHHNNIRKIVVEGSRLLPQEKVQEIISRYIGHTRDNIDIQSVEKDFEAAYHAAGYDMSVDILPVQDAGTETLTLKIIAVGGSSVKMPRMAEAPKNVRPVVEASTMPLKVESVPLNSHTAVEPPVKTSKLDDAADPVSADKGPEVIRFEIRKIIVNGNSLLSQEKIRKITDPYIGSGKDFGDVQHIVEDLETAYHAMGYNLVVVILPEQELTGGIVTIRIMEPKLVGINIEGNKYFSQDNIIASFPSLRLGETPMMKNISMNMKSVNENPAKKVTIQLQPGEKEDELKANLKVIDDKQWQIGLGGDNTGNKSTGEYRMSLFLQHFNLFNLDHVISLQYTTAPDNADTVKIFSGSYRVPLYSLGDTIDFFGGYSDVSGSSQTTITDVNFVGKGIISGFRYNHNLKRIGNYEHKLLVGMDYRVYDNAGVMTLSGLPPTPLSGQGIGTVVTHPLSLTYGGTLGLDFGEIEFSLGGIHNDPWGGQGKPGDFNLARLGGAVSDYTLFRYGINLGARLPADWQMRTTFNGQVTDNRLIPGEQFGLGGASSIRGYEEREDSKDNGFSGSFELYTPELAALAGLSKAQLRLLGFCDGGYGYNVRPVDQEGRQSHLVSAGAGFRLGVASNFSFGLDWGYVFQPSTISQRGDSKIHFKGMIVY
jgi:hemolysin activation/secretion protein